MGRVFILGAGSSVFAGYPLATNLWPWVVERCSGEYMAGERRNQTVTELKPILKKFARPLTDEFDLEEIFTYLDLAELGRGPLANEVPSWRKLRYQVMGMIADAFQAYQHDLARAISAEGTVRHLPVDPGHVRDVAARWVDLIQPGDQIITFNWDLLQESMLWRAGKWHYADGYGFLASDAGRAEHSPVTLLKLHGSVNWAQRDEQDVEPDVVFKSDFFLGASDDPQVYDKGLTDWSDGHRLIIPTYLKDISANRLLLRIWNRAAALLQHATQVIVIGSQLNPADTPARLLFALALGANTSLQELIVVTPPGGPDHWAAFAHNIGQKLRLVPKKFEDWLVEEGTPQHPEWAGRQPAVKFRQRGR